MKKRFSIFNLHLSVPVALALVFLAVACNKEHQCKCDVTDDGVVNKLQLLTVDDGLKCENIKEMSVEKMIVDSVSGHHTFTRIETVHLSCREYAGNENN